MGDLDEIEARANAATKGPWEIIGGGEYVSGPDILVAPGEGGVTDADAEFIAHARRDVPRLIGAVKWLADQLHERSGGDPEAWAAEALGGDA